MVWTVAFVRWKPTGKPLGNPPVGFPVKKVETCHFSGKSGGFPGGEFPSRQHRQSMPVVVQRASARFGLKLGGHSYALNLFYLYLYAVNFLKLVIFLFK